MPQVFTSKTQKTGQVGENVAVRFLMKHGFLILGRNYTKKWGEIDIIAENKKENKIHFIEVKSVTHETYKNKEGEENDNYRPEDNMHPWKLKRLSRAIQTYILEKDIDEDKEWQVDLAVVYLDLVHKKARVKLVKDIVL